MTPAVPMEGAATGILTHTEWREMVLAAVAIEPPGTVVDIRHRIARTGRVPTHHSLRGRDLGAGDADAVQWHLAQLCAEGAVERFDEDGYVLFRIPVAEVSRG